ncbi:MAG: hypothetical protein ACRDYC_08270 [Acidimicrobiales bacterium]
MADRHSNTGRGGTGRDRRSHDHGAEHDDAGRRLEHLLTEGAYAAVGLGVLGFQRAQVRRRQLESAMRGRAPGLSGVVHTVDHAVAPVRRVVDRQVDFVEMRLPAGARAPFGVLRRAAGAPERFVRGMVGADRED